MVDVLLGLQWGDEGKGKIVDYLADKYQVIARFQGGPNAGHTLYVRGNKIVLHTIPSGIFHPHCLNLIGNGVVIDPITLHREIEAILPLQNDILNRLFIANKAHLIVPTHRAIDAATEASKGSGKIGSTLKGIGPAYMDKTGRRGLRVGDIFQADFNEKYNALKSEHLQVLSHYDAAYNWEEWEQPFMDTIAYLRQLQTVDATYWLDHQLSKGSRVLAEGAQGTMLDVDFGTYPFVTSSSTIASGVSSGLGIAPSRIKNVYGITKAYCTRVGSGPFPTELLDETGDALRKAGAEFGATTGRPRRCGWIDLVALRYAVLINGVNKLIITKADVLDEFDPVLLATAYQLPDGTTTQEAPYALSEDQIKPIYQSLPGWGAPIASCQSHETLPNTFEVFCATIEQYLGVPISLISNGAGRDQIIVRNT